MRQQLLRLLVTAPRSLAELSAACGVGPQTLRRDLVALMDAGWVAEVGVDNTTGGRPARIYGPDGSSHLLVGLHLEIPTARLSLVGLDGSLLGRRDLRFEPSAPPTEALRRLVSDVRELDAAHPGRELVGVGVAAPGFVNPETGGLLSVGREPQWDSFPVREHLRDELGVPVTIANDVDCMAHEEFVPGGWDEPDTLYVGYGEGVKISLYLDGRPYHGRLGNAGLVGSTRVTGPAGAPVPLEQLSSVAAVCDAFADAARPDDPEHARILALDDRTARFRAIVDAAAAGLAPAARILDGALAALAEGLADAVVLLQPQAMVVGGALDRLDEHHWAGLQDAVRARVHPLIGNQLRIRRARRSSDLGAALGAAKLALQALEPTTPVGTATRRDAHVG